MEYPSSSTTPLEDDLYQSDIVTGAHGDKYQKDLALAIFERATRKGYDFKLGYEMAIADKFDDVAFFNKSDNKWTLIQTKHADTSKGKVPPLKFDMLFPSDHQTREKGDFSLFKYLKSYMTVQDNIKGQKNVVIFTNREFLIDQSVEFEPRQVDEILCFTNDTRQVGLKVTNTLVTEMKKYVNRDFISLKNSIIKLFQEGSEDQVIKDYKTPLARIFTKTDNCVKFLENPPSDAYQMLDSLSDIIDIQTAQLPLHKAKDLFNGKSRNKTWPLCANFDTVHQFFQDLILFTGQPDDLRSIIDQDLRLWVRTWMRPDYFQRLEDSQLTMTTVGLENFFNEKKAPVKKANETYKKMLKLTDGNEFLNGLKKEFEKQIHNLSNYLSNHAKKIYINRQVKFMELSEIDCYITIPDENFVDELSVKFRNQSFLFLTAEPGMGKSTILEYIAFAAQQKSSLCVYFFHLNVFEEKLAQFNNTDKIEEFISILQSMLSETNYCTLRDSFKDNCNERTNFMIFDALDEVSPPNRKKVLNVFKQMLTKPNTKILVSARNSIKTLVENEFEIKSMSLVPFDNQNQMDFLRQFWIVSEENDSKFQKYVANLFKVFHSDINRALCEFAGLPLMLKMIAEVYATHFNEYLNSELNNSDSLIPESTLSVITLYEQFVRKCFANKMMKKFNFFLENDEETDLLLKNYTLEHQLMAIKHLQIKDIQCIYQEAKYAEILNGFDKRLRTGTEKSALLEAVDDNITFIHRSYAEFLVASYFYSNFFKCEKVVFESESRADFLNENPMIRSFFFATIENRFDIKILEILEKHCSNNCRIALWAYEVHCIKTVNFLLRPTNGSTIVNRLLCVAVEDNYHNLCAYLFKNHQVIVDWEVDGKTPLQIAAKNGYVNIVKLLIDQSANVCAKDAEGNNLLHLSAEHGHSEVVELLIENSVNIEAKDTFGKTPLHVAAKNGHTNVIKLLHENSADLNAKQEDGATPLHLATQFGRTEVVKLIIAKSADIESKNNYDMTPLHFAAQNDRPEIVKLLIEKFADIEAKQKDSKTPLHLAAEKGHTEVVELLIANFADIEAKQKNAKTPLHLATEKGHTETVKLLIAKSADIESKHKKDGTPLHFAAANGHSEIIKMLIAKFANIEAKYKKDGTPLHLATVNGHLEIVKLLIKNFADIEAKTSKSETSLHLAAKNGHSEIVDFLIAKSANIEAKTNYDATPLHLATEYGHLEIVKLLISKSADIEAKQEDGMTSLHLATKNGHFKIVNLLIAKSADIEAQQEDDETPLHFAAANGHTEVVKLLIANNADIEAKQEDDKTPLHLASKNGHSQIVELLIANSADIDAKQCQGKTPIKLATENGHTDVVKILTEHSKNKKRSS